MKKIQALFFVLLAALLFMGAYTIFSGKMIVKVKDTDHEKTLSLQLANLDKQFTNIYIVGVDDRVWYNDYIWNKNGYSANIDLSALESGDYMLCINNSIERAAVALFVTNEQVVFVNTNRPGFTLTKEAYFRPTAYSRLLAHMYVDGARPALGVRLANLNEGETTVRLSGFGGQVLFDETFKGQVGYHKMIDLTGVQDGSYYLYLNTVEAKVFQMMEMNDGALLLGPTMGKERALLRKRTGVAAQ